MKHNVDLVDLEVSASQQKLNNKKVPRSRKSRTAKSQYCKINKENNIETTTKQTGYNK